MQTSASAGNCRHQPSTSGVWEVEASPPSSPATPSTISPTSESVAVLRDWLLLVPEYDGSPHKLEQFAASVRYVSSRLADDRALLFALGAKLRGRARDVFQQRLHRLACLEDLLYQLRLHFSGLGSEARLLDRLDRARQSSAESVEEFGVRLEKLSSQLRCVYEESEGSPGESKRMLRDAALVRFRRGLRSSRLEVAVAACEPKTLEEAVAVAVAIENQMRSSGELTARRDRRVKRAR